MKSIQLLACLSASLLASGCATIVTGSSQEVTLVSEPSGASVSIDGNNRGMTPLTISLKRKETPTFVLTSDGYMDEALALDKSSNGWVWGNIVLGGIIGLAVDMGTGAHQKFDQDVYTVRMRPSPPQTPLRPAAVPTANAPRSDLEVFLVAHHADLIADVASGSGETLLQFYSEAGVAHGREAEAVKMLGSLYRLAASPDEFRRMVLAEYTGALPMMPVAASTVPVSADGADYLALPAGETEPSPKRASGPTGR